MGDEDWIEVSPQGLYCRPGGFHIDPWRGVERAVITHAHADHARPGSKHYLCEASGADILRARVGRAASLETLAYGETRRIGGVEVSLHPAGHILGSSQVRVAWRGRVTVVSGDYNATHPQGTCVPFEPVPCETFISESTFGLPIYRWPEPEQVFADIRAWWQAKAAQGITCVLPAYPLGKSQRLLAGLRAGQPGPIALHGSVKTYAHLYAQAGVALADWQPLSASNTSELRGTGLVITSAAAQEVGLVKKLQPLSWAFASGWMMTRAARRNRDFDRGFVLSDHADWQGLLTAIRATGASRIGVTHGQTEAFGRYLREQGYDSFTLPTHYTGEGMHEGLHEEAAAAES